VEQEWVEVYRSPNSAGFPEGLERLAQAGIPARGQRTAPSRYWLGRSTDADVIYVPADQVDAAREVLAAWDAESEADVETHLAGVRSELAVVACVVALFVGVPFLVTGSRLGAIACAVVFLACLPAAWRRLRRPKSESDAPAKTKAKRWF
jgi:hypothetical protein